MTTPIRNGPIATRAEASRAAAASGPPPPRTRPRAPLLAPLLALLLALPAAGPAGAVDIDFPGQISVPVFDDAVAVAAWDGDGDGRSDLIVGGRTGLLARVVDLGRGRYAATALYGLGGEIVRLRVGPPAPGVAPLLLVLTRGPDRLVFVALDAGTPYFEKLSEVLLEEDPGDLALGALGEGGGPGIAVTLPGIDRWLLLEPRDDLWQVTQEVPTGDRPERIVAVDLDLDGGPELVTVDEGVLSRGLSLFDRGPAGWQLNAQMAARGTPSGIVVQDEDADGVPELFVSHGDSALVEVLEVADGGLRERAVLPLPMAADGLVVGPVVSGRTGLLAWSASRGTIHYLERFATGWAFEETFYGGGEALDGALTELNGDGARDLVLANGQAGSVGLLFGNRAPSFRAYLAETLPPLPSAGLLRDENGDGHLDLLVACAGGPSIETLLGDGLGHLRRQPGAVPLEAGPQALVGLDANEDGLGDLALLEPVADRLRVLCRLPDGGYETRATVATGDGPVQLLVEDFDRDGHQDLLVGSQIVVGLMVAYGDGTGAFPDVRAVPLGLSRVGGVAAVDLDLDGLPDLVTSGGVGNVQTQVNLGDRSFGRAIVYNLLGGPGPLAAGDLDGDGDEDLVLGLTDDRALMYLQNRGNGGIILRGERVPLPSRPGHVVLGQIDLIGRPDIVVTLPDDGAVGVSVNVGDWSWSPPLQLASALEPSDVLVADLNEDGVPDLATLDRTLGLALSMLNIEPDPVPVAPPALTATAGADGIELVVRVEGDAGWRLEGGTGTGWAPLAADGAARHGRAEPSAEAWRLRLDEAAAAAAGLAVGADGACAFRLLGAGGDLLGAATAVPPWAAAEAPTLVVGRPRPNPGNPAVALAVDLARPALLRAAVWDLAGRRVATLAAGWRGAGRHVLRWDGRRDGRPAAAGQYLLTVEAAGRRVSRKVTLLK